MANKTAKKKKTIKRAVEDMAANEVIIFKGLLQHPGWQKLAQIMSENEDLLKEQIISKTALDGSALSNEQVDRIRDRLADIVEIRTSPERYIKLLTSKEDAEDEDYDPYEKAGEKLFDMKQ
jgi:hypothetical protein